MRTEHWTVAILAAAVLATAGCGKSHQEQQGPPPMNINGVEVDVPKLRSLPFEKPELRDDVNQASMGIRYGDYDKALAALAKLAADPSLTEPQKKVVNDVIGQVKQLLAKPAH